MENPQSPLYSNFIHIQHIMKATTCNILFTISSCNRLTIYSHDNKLNFNMTERAREREREIGRAWITNS